MILFYLKQAIVFASSFIQVLLQCLLGIVIILVLFLFFWFSDQGHDMLFTLNQNHGTVTVFLLQLGVLAVFVLYYPRFLFEDNLIYKRKKGIKAMFTEEWISHDFDLLHFRDDIRDHKDYRKGFRKMAQILVPRFLGNSVFMVPAFGIQYVMVKYSIGDPWFKMEMPGQLTFAFVVVAILSLIDFLVLGMPKKTNGKLGYTLLTLSILAFLSTLLPFIIMSSSTLHGLGGLQYLSFTMIMAGVALSLYTAGRRLLLKHGKTQQSEKNHVSNCRFEAWFLSHKALVFFLSTGVLVNLLYYIYSNIYSFSNIFKEAIIIICASLLVITAVLFLISYYQLVLRLALIPFLLVSLLFFGILMRDQSHYNLTGTKNPTIQENERVDFDAYLKSWFAERRTEIIKGSKPYPIYLINHEGGGSRAGYWSFIVSNKLESLIPDFYKNRVFGITGSSGGMNGAGVYELFKISNSKSVVTEEKFSKGYFGKDYISTSIALLLGLDLWQGVLSTSIADDRGARQEKDWENQAAQLTNELLKLDEPLLNIKYINKKISTERPLLLFNTTHVESGQRFINWPIKRPKEMEWAGDFAMEWEKTTSAYNQKFSNALLLNSRFPYISPVGKLEGLGTFADAGAYNNFSSSTTVAVARAIKRYLEGDTALANKLVINCILVTNDPYKDWSQLKKANGGIEKENVSTQIFAPPTYIANHRAAYHVEAFWELENAVNKLHHIALATTEIMDGKDKIKPALPLARSLSSYSMQAMDSCLQGNESVERTLQAIVDEQ